jgi:hypothetical protein
VLVLGELADRELGRALRSLGAQPFVGVEIDMVELAASLMAELDDVARYPHRQADAGFQDHAAREEVRAILQVGPRRRLQSRRHAHGRRRGLNIVL